MLSRMSRIVLCIMIVLCCACQAIDQESVGGSARAKCRRIGVSDESIDSLFILIEAWRDDGLAGSDAVFIIGGGCDNQCLGNSTCDSECLSCGLAIFNEVYDE